jgi:protein SCO1/2
LRRRIAEQLKAGVFDPPRPAPEFALPSSMGTPLTAQSDYRGKVVVLEFGYTHCPDVCPVSLASLARRASSWVARGKDVQVLFVTVDPARDTAERLHAWLANFDPGFVGITGSEAQIGRCSRTTASAPPNIRSRAANEYTMSHSSYLYFIDRQGRQRAMMPFGRPPPTSRTTWRSCCLDA